MKPKTALYVVATPIGNLDDITTRAIETLKQVDFIAAEDTRHSKRLLDECGIHTPLISLHEHNEEQRTAELIAKLEEGKSIALISDAGTPLISDPGYHLVRAVRSKQIPVIPIPGCCALITALSASGLPSDSFIFEGFLPTKRTQRKKYLALLKDEPRTLIFYESPHRIIKSIEDLSEVFGKNRVATIARELTKTFETIHNDTLENLLTWLNADLDQQKGEFVVLVQGAEKIEVEHIKNIEIPLFLNHILITLLAELSLKQAVQLAVNMTGIPKNTVYEMALALKNESKN